MPYSVGLCAGELGRGILSITCEMLCALLTAMTWTVYNNRLDVFRAIHAAIHRVGKKESTLFPE